MDTLSLIQVREKAQITLPSKIRKFFGIKEGDYLEPKIEKRGILLQPKMLFDKVPIAVLSKKEEEELENVLQEVKNGEVETFNSMEDLIEDLHN